MVDGQCTTMAIASAGSFGLMGRAMICHKVGLELEGKSELLAVEECKVTIEEEGIGFNEVTNSNYNT